LHALSPIRSAQPTNAQPFSDTPEPHEISRLGPALDLEGTIQLLNAQTTTAKRMRGQAESALEQTSAGFAALMRRGDQLRTRIRALEADLAAPQAQISQGDVAHRVTLEIRGDELERVRSELSGRLDEMQDVANRIAATRQALRAVMLAPPGIFDSASAWKYQLLGAFVGG